MNWWLPPRGSTYAGELDNLFYIILGVTGVIFLLVEAALVYFIFKYRSRAGRKAQYIEGSTRVEIVWTVIPAIIVLVLAFLNTDLWSRIKDPDRFPTPSVRLAVEAKQFEWNVTYPGPDGELGTGDDFTKRNQLHVPVHQTVLITLTARDVIHSFFVPEFRIKQDAVPGMEIPVWFEATTPGEFELACAELCGLGHYRMRATVTVHTPEDYGRWMEAESGAGPEAGEAVTASGS